MGNPGAGLPAAREGEPRRLLFAALTAGDPVPRAALTALARAARWPLPGTVRAVVLAAPCEPPPLTAAFPQALAGRVEGEPCFLLAGGPEAGASTRETLEPLLHGWTAAVGQPVPPGEAAASVRWARRLLELAPPWPHGEGQHPLFVDDHLSTLLLLQDESLARAFAARWLGPLAELTPRQSERLELTLLAWLENGGAPEAARVLQVHPQTVRYRLRQLEKVFGPVLRDPHARFELELALRGRRLFDRTRRTAGRAATRRPRAAGPLGTRTPGGAAKEARINGL